MLGVSVVWLGGRERRRVERWQLGVGVVLDENGNRLVRLEILDLVIEKAFRIVVDALRLSELSLLLESHQAGYLSSIILCFLMYLDG